ncbi:MAG: PA2169 family four-helix-bundle protein [Flavobacteriales bacterium]|nr:PA2169 family four-helix-bundle protein [Flavobacteriales bacterium]
MNNTEQQTGLCHILDLLGDSRKSYMELCNRVEDRRTKDLLSVLSWERIALESALMAEVRRVGSTAMGGGAKTAGVPPAAWREVRAALAVAKGAHVLEACERGEEYLLMRYDKELQRGDLETATRTVMLRQRAQVQGNVHNVRSRTQLAVPSA